MVFNVKNFKLKFASCFMIVFLMCNIILPIVKPQKVHAVTLETITTLMAVSVGSRIGVALTDNTVGSYARSDVENVVSQFWVKAAEDGMVSEYQAELNTSLSSLSYDVAVDAWVWQGVPHVSGRLLQTLADVISDYYAPIDARNVGMSNSLAYYIETQNCRIYCKDDTYIYIIQDYSGKALDLSNVRNVSNNERLDCLNFSASSNTSTLLRRFYIDTGYKDDTFAPYGNISYIRDNGVLYWNFSCGVDFKNCWLNYTGWVYTFVDNRKIKALPTYALPKSIPSATVTAIQDGADTIPTDGFANITYEGGQWTYEGDNYYIIDRDAEVEPEPTPMPTPDPTPTPDPDQPADDATVNEWLKAIYLKLVSLDSNIAQMLPAVITDLVAINDSIKDLATAGGLTGTDSEAQQGAFTNLFSGLLEFLRAALVPTQELNLAQLNVTPEDLNNKFPFSVAGDIARLFTIFEAAPVAPLISIDFDISMLGGGIIPLTMDFSHFDAYAGIFRNLLFVSFLITLVWMTFKMFMGGGSDE